MTLPLIVLTIGLSNRRSDGDHIAVRGQLFFELPDFSTSIAVPCLECISTLSSGVVVPGAICDSMTGAGSAVFSASSVRGKISGLARPEVPQSSWKATSVIIIHCVVDCAYINYLNGQQGTVNELWTDRCLRPHRRRSA